MQKLKKNLGTVLSIISARKYDMRCCDLW